MSSAALPAQYQQTTPGRDQYVANYSSSPPSSRQRPTKRSSNGNATSAPNTPQQYTSPAMTMLRGQDQVLPSTQNQWYPEQSDMSTPSTVLPIRTSSQQAAQTPTTTAYDDRPYSSRAGQQSSGYGSGSERERASDSDRRRTGYRSPRESPAQAQAPGSGRSQRSRNAPQQSRSTNAVGQPPIDTSLPRENSAIINHIVVDDPQEDLARERARVAEARPVPVGTDVTPVQGLGLVGEQGVQDEQRSSQHRSRQEHLRSQPHRKEVKFGDYILGQTLGEGEFGKVKMGWKKEGGVQVAIKLIRKESLAGNTTRLPKIYREIAILRELQHPNIVRLHEMVETERHIGIILEYASGGELFDYILNHRYLKDNAARRLFAQLVSGVGYLHKKGIVHRDLKLENLLLDRNKNIIITDFGFANTFDAHDELGEDVERNIGSKDFIKSRGLDEIGKDGHRRGDLMQTSCGSPCYAAPELVVSDSLYTGRKVDVWSCGVILVSSKSLLSTIDVVLTAFQYAMLAGYLPFDDDPANPEGDNINLLYKYIVSTALTFPEYVTPHARDLLRRILVPDPRKRADLFEVARHSWLSEYSHVVGFITSNTVTERDLEKTSVPSEEPYEPMLARSASVREPATRPAATTSPGGLSRTANMGGDETEDRPSKQRDAKRRTVQVEYVAPSMATARGETSPPISSPDAQALPVSQGRTRARADSQGPVEVTPTPVASAAQRSQRKIQDLTGATSMAPPSRPGREPPRSVSDNAAFASQAPTSASRPTTQGSMGVSSRLPSRGNSYSQPVAATPTNTNAQGRFSQPKPAGGYMISGPIQPDHDPAMNSRPVSGNFSQFQTPPQGQAPGQTLPQKGHKRSSTLSSIGDKLLGRSNSRRQSQNPRVQEKPDRKYPPVSMRSAMPNNNEESQGRTSTESRRPSFGFSRKNSDGPSQRSSRRFSWLPTMSSFTNKKDAPNDAAAVDQQSQPPRSRQEERKAMAFGRGASRSPSQSTTNSTIPLYYDANREEQKRQNRNSSYMPNRGPTSQGNDKPLPAQPQQQLSNQPQIQRKQFRDDGYGFNSVQPTQTNDSEQFYTPTQSQESQATEPAAQQNRYRQQQPQYPQGFNEDSYDNGQNQNPARGPQGLRQQTRKFGDAYEQQGAGGHGGSSGGARRVMDWFRNRRQR